MNDPAYIKAKGLCGPRLLEHGDPGKVIYSFSLYERGPGVNLLRIQLDNYDQPLNIDEGVKLELGSSAKLRTLITYMEIISELYDRYASLSRKQLSAISESDCLSQWEGRMERCREDQEPGNVRALSIHVPNSLDTVNNTVRSGSG